MRGPVALVQVALFAALASAAPVLVQIVHRHGDRGPTPMAPSVMSQWQALNIGPGQLTPRGADMLKAYGSLLNERYVQTGFLKAVYDYTQIRIRSTDVDRCLMSVTALLNTLYPNQQLPVHTVPTHWDDFLQMWEHCAAYQSEQPAIDDAFDQMLVATYSHLLDVMQQWAQWPGQLPVNDLMWSTYDNVVCARAHNISLGVMEPYADLLINLTRQNSFQEFESFPADMTTRGTVGGALVTELLSNIDGFVTGNNNSTKFHIYSGHDTTLSAVASTLGLLAPGAYVTPTFAESFVFELHIEAGQPVIRAFMGVPVQNATTGLFDSYELSPMQLLCPQLSDACPFNDLNTFLRARIVPNGCCYQGLGFTALGCNQNDVNTANLPSSCQLYRQFCPGTVCGDGYVLDTSAQVCVATGAASSSSSSFSGKWFGVGIAVTVGAGILMLVGMRCRKKASSGDHFDQMGP